MADDATRPTGPCTVRTPNRSDSPEPDGARSAASRSRSGPRVRRWVGKHRATIRRWAGLGALALGVGAMAGGLEPLGLSLILLGTAQLLVVFEKTHSW